MTAPIERFTLFERATGRVLSAGTTQLPERMVTALHDVLVGEGALPNESYVHLGKVVKLPVQPSLHHVFDYALKQWHDPRTNETQWPVVRIERNKRLSDCDFTQLADAPSDKRAWAVYRQALRDITKQLDPFVIVWPVAPA